MFMKSLIKVRCGADVESARFEAEDIEPSRHRLYSNERLALRQDPRQVLRQAQDMLGASSGPFRLLICSSVGDLERKKGTNRALFESKWLPGQDSNLQPDG
jgi:hypothetical protein